MQVDYLVDVELSVYIGKIVREASVKVVRILCSIMFIKNLVTVTVVKEIGFCSENRRTLRCTHLKRTINPFIKI